MSVGGTQRVWRPRWPCPVGSIAVTLRHGGADPTYRTDPDGTIWRGLRTPEGTATLRISSRPSTAEVVADAWGEGADWALAQLPAILVFAVKWLPRDPRRAVMMIGLQGLAFIAAALPVALLEL